MFKRISLKIVCVLVVVLAILMAIFTQQLVAQRGAALEAQLLTKARTMAIVGSKAMELALEEALSGGQFNMEQLFDTDYQQITSGPYAKADPPKFKTAYDLYLDMTIKDFQDAMVENDPMIVFAVLVDRNGYLPTHNTKYTKKLTGDKKRDNVGNRTKRIFNAGDVLLADDVSGRGHTTRVVGDVTRVSVAIPLVD